MDRRSGLSASVVLCLLLFGTPLLASVSTPHLISFQGRALDPGGAPLANGDVAVRIYDAPTAGALVFDSGAISMVPFTTGSSMWFSAVSPR